MTDPQYHLTCEVCGELFWSTDAYAEECPHHIADVVTVIDKLYPARWDPKGADDCGILYCADTEYAFGIDPDVTEAWWGPQLAEAINDAHDLRAEVARLRTLLRFAATVIEHGINRLDDDEAIREHCDWLNKARAALEVQS